AANNMQPAPPRSVPQVVVRRQRIARRVTQRFFWLPRREALFVATTLAAAGLLRLVLAARGWPYVNSDEATVALMVDDIMWRGWRPAFTYGEHHVGSLDSYLQVPGFIALGPTSFALHSTTTLQFLLFLFVLYHFTRYVFSPLVACGTLLLLAAGPGQALFFSMRAGHHAQDVLLLGALLLWLVVLRMRRSLGGWRRTAVHFCMGLVAGLGIWSTTLLLPFVLAAVLALGVEAWRRWRTGAGTGAAAHTTKGIWPRFAQQALPAVVGALLGLAPFLSVTLASRGAILREVLGAAGAGGRVP